jgi:DNA invertase Pin-like site-specific DNA recombinase
MLLIPRGGDPTQPQIAAIEDNLRSIFDFEQQELTERLTQGRFIAARADGFEHAAKLFSDLIKKRLTAEEKQQLITMIEQVARLDGPSQTQTAAIATLAQRIGLAPAA